MTNSSNDVWNDRTIYNPLSTVAMWTDRNLWFQYQVSTSLMRDKFIRTFYHGVLYIPEI